MVVFSKSFFSAKETCLPNLSVYNPLCSPPTLTSLAPRTESLFPYINDRVVALLKVMKIVSIFIMCWRLSRCSVSFKSYHFPKFNVLSLKGVT